MSADKFTHPLYVGLAQQVGINLLSHDLPKLIAFAEQVAVRATLLEREECAKVCESRQTPGTGSVAILNGAADAIRARGQA